jgi:putative methyltransferase (TIGR04325 family)
VATVTQIHPNFQSALAACGAGYDAGDIADTIAFKAALPIAKNQIMPEQAVNSIVSVAMAAAEVSGRPLSVLDFGGGCGFHYAVVSRALTVPLRWAIVETPTMAERARKIAQGRFDVYTDVAEAVKAMGRIDLVHASSAIQYVPDPLASLRALAALQAPFFALARFPLWRSAQVVGVQLSKLAGNGIGPMPPNIPDREVAYPVTFVNIDDVLAIFNRYEMALATPSPSSEYSVRGQGVPGISVFFRSKERQPAD